MRFAGPDQLPIDVVGTKTGTPQKVPGEVCGHVELAHNQAHREAGTPCSRACRKALKQAERPHRSCYTPSMAIFGRRSGPQGDGRELMVLVVVDEPRKGKFGGDVAGPAAVAILREALGLTRMGEVPVHDLVRGFAPASMESGEAAAEISTGDQPWAEAGW